MLKWKKTPRIDMSETSHHAESNAALALCQPCNDDEQKAIHQCDVCHKAFSQHCHLTTHKRTHTGEKPFQCDVCHKAFSDSSTLTKHKRTHTGEKPFHCDVCHQAFTQSSTLTTNKRSHTGEKPFQCDVCHKAFADSSTLAKHKRTHTGEKPFHCDVCHKAFTQSGNLTKHKRTHTGEKPFQCDVCHKAFSDSSHLTAHKRSHTGEKPFHCDVCDMAFANSSNLTSHMQRIHSDTYIARRKEQEQRVCEALLAAGWSEWHHPEAMPPAQHFKREKRIDFSCVDQDDTWCRIDFVLAVDGGYVFLEVDEHQHQFGYDANLSCDMKRMAKVMTSLIVEAGDALPHIYWLRYNPHAWHVDGGTKSVPKAEREHWLCTFLASLELTKPLILGYAYYDSADGKLDVLANDEFHPAFAEVAVDISH